MRAESYNFATYLDQVSNLRAYGGKSLHEQSHGESFMALFTNRFEQGLYLLDEPEAAFSQSLERPFRRESQAKMCHLTTGSATDLSSRASISRISIGGGASLTGNP